VSSTIREAQNLATALQFLEALERGADAATLRQFLHPDVVQQEFPNRMTPQGARRNLPAILESAERGKKVMASQRFEVRSALVSAGQVALEVAWTGTLAVEVGGLAAGTVLHAFVAIFMEFRDGRIVLQRNYDCYEPS
jgi:ketosteroid isomerase-like protein